MEQTKITYYALLETKPWKEFREKFLKERNYTCEECGRQLKYGLVVHHKRYYAGHKPWEYGPDDLQCLCVRCHEAVHSENSEKFRKIHVYDSKGELLQKVPDSMVCRYCAGEGRLEKFSKLMDGLCFRCFGTGLRFVHRYSPEEARLFGMKFYHQWRKNKENSSGEVPEDWSSKFLSPSDVTKWLLEMNDKQ